jgi:hypothetical protein
MADIGRPAVPDGRRGRVLGSSLTVRAQGAEQVGGAGVARLGQLLEQLAGVGGVALALGAQGLVSSGMAQR